MSTVRIQLRRGQSSDWTSANPVLAAGEAGLESDTLQIKIGDGTTNWNDLGYATVTPTNLTDAVNAAITGTVDTNFVDITELGVANGVATLDSNGLVPDSQINSDIARHSDVTSAVNTAQTAAETFATNSANTAQSNAESYADTAATNAENAAKSYTDSAISTEVTNRNAAIGAAESSAISSSEAFTTSAVNTAQTAAETFATNAANTAQSNAETFATNADVVVLSSAKAYTDTKVADLVSSAPDTLNTLKELADAINDDKNFSTTVVSDIATGVSNAKSYTDSAITTLNNSVTNSFAALNLVYDGIGAASTAETAAKSYADSLASNYDAAGAAAAAQSAAETFATNADVTILANAESYTDSKIANEVTNRNTAITNAVATATTAIESVAQGYASTAQSAATSAAETFATNAVTTETNRAEAAEALLAPKASPALTGTPTAPTATALTNNTQIATTEYTDSAVAAEATARATAVTNAISTAETYAATQATNAQSAATTAAETYADSHASTLTNKTISGSANTLSNIPNSATTATSQNTASAIVARDSSGNFNANMITLAATPVNSGDVVTKAYADTIASGMNWHQAVVAATSAVLPSSTYTDGTTDADGGKGIGATLVATANGTLTIDGVSVSNGNRVLVKNQATATQNGIYVVTSNGGASAKWTLTRATDYDNHLVAEVTPGDAIYVEYGTNNASQAFVETATGTGTNGAIIIGTDNITFSQFTGTSAITASTGINVSGNSISVDPTVVAELTATQTLTNKTLTSPTINNPTVGGTLTYASGAYITFADGTTQSTAGVPSVTPINTQTASITLSSSYVKDSFVQINSASAATVTIPADSTYSYPVGASITFQALGAGQVSFVAASGVTAQYTPGLKLRTQYSVATIQKVAANTWAIYGDLSA